MKKSGVVGSLLAGAVVGALIVAAARAEVGALGAGRPGKSTILHLALVQSEESPASIYRNNIHGVFTIYAGERLGTGFVFRSGFIATNAHVVGEASVVEVEPQEGSRFRATVVSKNVELDYAILEPEGIRPFATVVSLQMGEIPAIGEGVVVIGSPGGRKGTVTSGIVSQIDPNGVIGLNAAVNPGNSGGPVFNLQGRVFGIATYKYNDGLGGAIPITRLGSGY